MAPIIPKGEPVQIMDQLIKDNRIAVFSKITCPFCTKVCARLKLYLTTSLQLHNVISYLKVKELFKSLNLEFAAIELDSLGKHIIASLVSLLVGCMLLLACCYWLQIWRMGNGCTSII